MQDVIQGHSSNDGPPIPWEKLEPFLQSFALIVLDEVNVLRTEAGLPDRNIAQLKQAMRAKYLELTT